jgi:tetratricopeptide (TPR) repeat protein
MWHALANVLDILGLVLGVPAMIYWGYVCYEHSDDRRGLLLKWAITAPLIVLIWIIQHFKASDSTTEAAKVVMVLFPAITIGLLWAPAVGRLIVKPFTNAFTGGDEEVELKPFYFLAEGKRRKGLYDEAILEVKAQLERFPGDFEGYMKLASIQMEDLKDLAAASATLNEFVNLPDRDPSNVLNTLNLLADWQLQFGRDAQAAAATLQRIVELYPDTPLAHAAQQRIAHLGSANETSRVRHESKFTVKALPRDLGLRKDAAPVAAAGDPAARAAEYVKQLEAHPRDTDTREKLAVLYAEEFQRMDLAAEQLEQMISLPEEPPKHVARWLNLLATLHIKVARDVKSAERALHRIVERFPGGALANVAVSRLATLNLELKSSQATAAKTLGVYEKDIGLKQAHES